MKKITQEFEDNTFNVMIFKDGERYGSHLPLSKIEEKEDVEGLFIGAVKRLKELKII